MLKFKFFTLGEYPQEEKWLHEMAENGMVLQKSILPCFYIFRKEKPQDLVYRYDFIPSQKTLQECISLYGEYGWTYVTGMNDFALFVRSARDLKPEDLEIFSSPESRREMIERILKNRMYPLLICLGFLLILFGIQMMKPDNLDGKMIAGACALIVGFVDFRCLLELWKLKKEA